MKKWLIGITALVIAVAAGYGLVNRFSYTNSSAAEDFEDQLKVYAKFEDGLPDTPNETIGFLSNANIILRVHVLSEPEYLFASSRQLVQVQEVYAGSQLAAGDEIYIANESQYVLSDMKTINMGFRNFMRAGEDYLIFIDKKIENDKHEDYDSYLIMGTYPNPAFCYNDIQNVVVPADEDGTVLYGAVKDNEFFCSSEEGYAWIQALKEALLKKYPKSE